MKCLYCKGEVRYMTSFPDYADGTSVKINRWHLHYLGEVDDRFSERKKLGNELRKRRMNPYRTIRAEAARRGMKAMDLSRIPTGTQLRLGRRRIDRQPRKYRCGQVSCLQRMQKEKVDEGIRCAE